MRFRLLASCVIAVTSPAQTSEIKDVLKSAEIDRIFAGLQGTRVVHRQPAYAISFESRSGSGKHETRADADQVLFVRKGAARLTIAGKDPRDIEAGDFIHLPRGTRYQFHTGETKLDVVSVQIFPAGQDRPPRKGFLTPRSMPDVLSRAAIADVFARFDSNQPIHSSPNYTLNYVIYSKKAGPWEAHRGCVDLYFVHIGTADAQLGGEIAGAREEGPGEIRGTGVSGARKYRIGPGDMVLIPREVAHHMQPLENKLGYVLMKIWAD